MRNSLPSLEGGGGQARIAGARGTLADHEPFAVADREPCVSRRRSWIFCTTSRALFSGSIYGLVVVGRSPTFESLQPELDRQGSK